MRRQTHDLLLSISSNAMEKQPPQTFSAQVLLSSLLKMYPAADLQDCEVTASRMGLGQPEILELGFTTNRGAVCEALPGRCKTQGCSQANFLSSGCNLEGRKAVSHEKGRRGCYQ